MKKLLVILTMLLCCSAFEVKAQMVYALGGGAPVSTQFTDVRYEFVQSQQIPNMAFLIDKYTGNVWRYMSKKRDLKLWKENLLILLIQQW